MQPVLTQVPPNCLRSTSATFIPVAVSRAAKEGPACPAPMTMVSKNWFMVARSGADMCAAFDAAHTPQARMGVRGSGPSQAHALEAPVAKLVFLIPSLDRCAIPLLRPSHAPTAPQPRALM